MTAHPTQGVHVVSGVLRFRANMIVKDLLDFGEKRGGLDLNEIANRPYTEEDRRQLAQLIGYSVSGYSDLSYAKDEDCLAAHRMAEGTDPKDARIAALEDQLRHARGLLRQIQQLAVGYE